LKFVEDGRYESETMRVEKSVYGRSGGRRKARGKEKKYKKRKKMKISATNPSSNSYLYLNSIFTKSFNTSSI